MRGTVRKMAPAQAVRMGSASPPVLITLVWQIVTQDGGGLWGLGLFHEDALGIRLPPLLYHHGAHVMSQRTRMCPQRQVNSIHLSLCISGGYWVYSTHNNNCM